MTIQLLGILIEPWQLVVTSVILLPLLYGYLFKNINYWTKRGLKAPTFIPLMGNMIQSLTLPRATMEKDWWKKYGKVYGTFGIDTEPVLTLGDPDLIKLILVKDFHLFRNRRLDGKLVDKYFSKNLFRSSDDDWKRLRSIMSPTFTSGKMKKMYDLIRTCSKEYLENFDMHAAKGTEANMKDLHGNFTMDVIAKCAFATATNSHKDPNDPFIVHAKMFFDFKVWRLLLVALLPKTVLKLIGLTSLTPGEPSKFFADATKQIIKRRRENNEKHNDFLQILMDVARDDYDQEVDEKIQDAVSHHVNEGTEEIEAEKKELDIKITKKKLDEDEIVAQCILFFIAGYETTATTLTFCTYELALNPHVQDRLYEEVKAVADQNGNIDYDTLMKLPYLDAVLSESLRKYPPVTRLERRAIEKYKLGDSGIELFKDQIVEIPVFAIHHSEEFYPNPEEFNPDRFMPENRSQIKPYTYLPFGAGPRNCIGLRFALLEAKLSLTKLIQKYKFVRSESTDIPLKWKPGLLLQAEKVVVGINKR